MIANALFNIFEIKKNIHVTMKFCLTLEKIKAHMHLCFSIINKAILNLFIY